MSEAPTSIRDELAGVRRDLVLVTAQLQEVTAQLRFMADHEGRIRELEKAIARSAWLPVIVTSVLMAGLGALVVRVIDIGI